MDTSKVYDNASKMTILLIVIGVFSLVAIYFVRKAINEAYADGILNDVIVRAEQRRNNLVSKSSDSEDEIRNYVEESRVGHRGYLFTVLDDSTSSLVKVETAKKAISTGICRALKEKFDQPQWLGLFEKVMILDRMGNEKLDISINNCPYQEIPILRFYVRFAPDIKEDEEVDNQEDILENPVSESVPSPTPEEIPSSNLTVPSNVSYTRPSVPAPSVRSVSCPSGTSTGGSGGIATSGCRCNRSGEIWNGRSCELKTCPAGSSRDVSATGDLTNVSGCRCNPDTPNWAGGRCISKCLKNQVLIAGECVCPVGTILKNDASGQCVECNEASDCFSGYTCLNNKCLEIGLEDKEDCRWGICQTCDGSGVRTNILDKEPCEAGGLHGVCNGNGTCYPTEGKACSSVSGCSVGEFCNYGGNFSSTKKQRGNFGQTPNVCQKVVPQEFTYQKVTYYYNTKQDLQSWCRAANNKPNCLWGYLSKAGAQSWCASLGKRLLTHDEMASVWDVLKEHLPQTYKGYAYWVQEGAWIVGKTGKATFNKVYPDGYGGKGGVVCK